MAFRCSDTNKFASYDEPEAEPESGDVTGTEYTATIRVVRPCAECGEEAAEYSFELAADVECPNCGTECGGHFQRLVDADPAFVLPDSILPSDPLPEDHDEFDLKEVDFELEDEDEPSVDESGGSRYKKNIFTCSVTATVLCLCCNETFAVEASDEAAASYFESLL